MAVLLTWSALGRLSLSAATDALLFPLAARSIPRARCRGRGTRSSFDHQRTGGPAEGRLAVRMTPTHAVTTLEVIHARLPLPPAGAARSCGHRPPRRRVRRLVWITQRSVPCAYR